MRLDELEEKLQAEVNSATRRIEEQDARIKEAETELGRLIAEKSQLIEQLEHVQKTREIADRFFSGKPKAVKEAAPPPSGNENGGKYGSMHQPDAILDAL